MNVPNIITMFRILLVPLLVIFLMEGRMGMAFLVFVVAGVSDALDGFVARMFKQKTVFGAYLDPLADKLLLNTSFVVLAIFGVLPGWLAVLVVSRDIIILLGFGILLLNGRDFEVKPSYYSKMTTLMQLVAVAFFLGHEFLGDRIFVEFFMVYITAFFTMLSGFLYIVEGFRILGRPSR